MYSFLLFVTLVKSRPDAVLASTPSGFLVEAVVLRGEFFYRQFIEQTNKQAINQSNKQAN